MKYKVGDEIIVTNMKYIPEGYGKLPEEFIGKKFKIKGIWIDNSNSRAVYFLETDLGKFYAIDEWIERARSFSRTWRYLTKEERI